MQSRYFRTAATMALVIVAVNFFQYRVAEGQGLLRRLQGRIQSRIFAPPPLPSTPSNDPETAPGIDAQGMAPRIQQAPGFERSPGAQRVAPLSSPRSRPGESEYGRSILTPPQDAASRSIPPNNPNSAAPSLAIDVLPDRGGAPGVRVINIREESLADDAGLRTNDLIVAVNGFATPRISDVARQLQGKQLGERVPMTVVRGESEIELSVPMVRRQQFAAKPQVGAPPVAPSPPINPLPKPATPSSQRSGSAVRVDAIAGTETTGEVLGIVVEDAVGQRGVIVSDVTADGPAASAGVKVGDRIVSIDGGMIADSAAWRQRLPKRLTDAPLALQLVRDQGLVNAKIRPLSQKPREQAAGDLAGGSEPGDPAPAESAGAGTLQGLGSVLGGFFGGKPAESKPAQQASPEDDQSRTDNKRKSDEMAFEDGEPVRQVGFERAERPPASRETGTKLADDPPSLDIIDLPRATEIDALADEDAPDTAPAADDQTKLQRRADQLRREIRQLEEQLRQLESEQADDASEL